MLIRRKKKQWTLVCVAHVIAEQQHGPCCYKRGQLGISSCCLGGICCDSDSHLVSIWHWGHFHVISLLLTIRTESSGIYLAHGNHTQFTSFFVCHAHFHSNTSVSGAVAYARVSLISKNSVSAPINILQHHFVFVRHSGRLQQQIQKYVKLICHCWSSRNVMRAVTEWDNPQWRGLVQNIWHWSKFTC